MGVAEPEVMSAVRVAELELVSNLEVAEPELVVVMWSWLI